MTPTSRGDDRLWAITSYYNPVGSRRRRENYRRFHDNLRVPLVAVELAFDRGFELAEGDADILIRLRGPDVMWQKERLLNIAVAALPAACRNVAWLDCDIVFARDEWAEEATAILDRCLMVQLFGKVHYLPADYPVERVRPDAAHLTRPSIASIAGSGRFAGYEGTGPYGLGPGATGMAWAARRELIEEHGHYDACIVGGGDNAMFAAAHRAPEHSILRQRMNRRQVEHYRAWADGFGRAVAGDVVALPGDIYHFWHGDLAKRGRPARHEMLAALGFDPHEDIAVAANGPWRWASDKPEMHNYLRSCFASREEDG